MIAKHIPRKKPGSFTKLAKYVAAAKEKGEKLDDFWIVNAKAGGTMDDLDLAIREVEAQQALNTKCIADKQYHLMVSFPKEEKPSLKALRDIERHFAQALGFADHPCVVGTHTNTEHFHMHVAYSRIHPKTFRAYSPQKDYFRLEKVCRLMEKTYGLQVDLGPTDKIEANQKPQAAQDKEAHTWEQSFHGYVNDHKDQLMKVRSKAKNWQDLHTGFAKYDLTLKKRGNGLVIGTGPNSENGYKHIKASALDRSFSKSALEKEFGLYKPPMKAQVHDRPLSQYKRRPLTRHPLQGRLWRQYIGQRKNKQSLVVKAFKTWREFLMLGIDDPLAMAIILLHRQIITAAFNPLSIQDSATRPTPPKLPLPAFDNGRHTPKPKDGQADVNRVHLDVPFKDKDLVKELGAKWDKTEKSWYVPDDADADIFKTWTKGQEDILQTMDVTHDQAERMGAFKEDALSIDDVLASADDLNLNGQAVPIEPTPEPQKQQKTIKKDSGRDFGME